MNFGKYIFSQIADFLPKRYFERLVAKSIDKSKKWELSAWNQLLVLMYGQLNGCKSLRELTELESPYCLFIPTRNFRSVVRNARSVVRNGRSELANVHSVVRNGDFSWANVQFPIYIINKLYQIIFFSY